MNHDLEIVEMQEKLSQKTEEELCFTRLGIETSLRNSLWATLADCEFIDTSPFQNPVMPQVDWKDGSNEN